MYYIYTKAHTQTNTHTHTHKDADTHTRTDTHTRANKHLLYSNIIHDFRSCTNILGCEGTQSMVRFSFTSGEPLCGAYNNDRGQILHACLDASEADRMPSFKFFTRHFYQLLALKGRTCPMSIKTPQNNLVSDISWQTVCPARARVPYINQNTFGTDISAVVHLYCAVCVLHFQLTSICVYQVYHFLAIPREHVPPPFEQKQCSRSTCGQLYRPDPKRESLAKPALSGASNCTLKPALQPKTHSQQNPATILHN